MYANHHFLIDLLYVLIYTKAQQRLQVLLQ